MSRTRSVLGGSYCVSALMGNVAAFDGIASSDAKKDLMVETLLASCAANSVAVSHLRHEQEKEAET